MTQIFWQGDAGKLLKDIVKNSPEALLIVNKNGQLILVNSASEKLWGYTESELLNMNVENLMPESFRQQHLEKRHQYMKYPKSRRMADERNMYILNQSLQEIPVDIALTPIKLKDEVYTMCTVLDTHERIRHEKRITEQAQHIQLIYDVTTMASDVKETEEALKICLDLICKTLAWPVGHIYLLQEDNEDLLMTSDIWHIEDSLKVRAFKEVTKETTFKKGSGLPGRIWATRQPIWIVDVHQDDNFPRAKTISKNRGICCCRISYHCSKKSNCSI